MIGVYLVKKVRELVNSLWKKSLLFGTDKKELNTGIVSYSIMTYVVLLLTSFA